MDLSRLAMRADWGGVMVRFEGEWMLRFGGGGARLVLAIICAKDAVAGVLDADSYSSGIRSLPLASRGMGVGAFEGFKFWPCAAMEEEASFVCVSIRLRQLGYE